MLGVIVVPFAGHLVDRMMPWWTAVISTVFLLVFQAVQTGAGGINVAAVIISCFGLDLFRQIQGVSLSTIIFRCNIIWVVWCFYTNTSWTSISETARSRLNALLVISASQIIHAIVNRLMRYRVLPGFSGPNHRNVRWYWCICWIWLACGFCAVHGHVFPPACGACP